MINIVEPIVLSAYLYQDKKYEFGLDTSGSVSNEELVQKIQLIQSLTHKFNAAESVVTSFDSERFASIPVLEINGSHLEGGGGSDSRPMFEKFDKDKYDGLIILTDGYTFFPKERPEFLHLVIFDDEAGYKHYEESLKRGHHAAINPCILGRRN